MSHRSSDSDYEYERDLELAKKRIKWLIQRKKLRDHERLKRKKIEEYERKRAETIRMELQTRASQERRNTYRQDGGSPDASRSVTLIL